MLFEQASQEFEQKQKKKANATPTIITPKDIHHFATSLTHENLFTSATATPLDATRSISTATEIAREQCKDLFKTPYIASLETEGETFQTEDEYLLEQLETNTTCFAEETINKEVIDVSRDLFRALEMRRKHGAGIDISNNDEQISYPWEVLRDGDNIMESDEDEQFKNARGLHHQDVTITYDPYDTSMASRLPQTPKDKIEMKDGVFIVTIDATGQVLTPPVAFQEHYQDYKLLSRIIYEAPTKSFCYTRLSSLELKFTLYKKLKQFEELKTQKMVPHRDWYNVRKVDTHLHLSSMPNQKHLLRFIKRKIKESPDEEVIVRDGKTLTLAEVFQSLDLTPYDLSVDTLDVHADKSQTMHRFDKFNLKYSPFGQSRLREIFLKIDNMIEGKYYAEISKKMFQDLEDSRYQHAEPRISIYGRKMDEWNVLAKWILNNQMYSTNVRWLIQIPRLYNVHKKLGDVSNVKDMLHNIFYPLFEATRCPEQYPELSTFLQYVVGLDSVDDESKPEPRFHSKMPTPEQWNNTENPPYGYYSYYFYANLKVLNAYRKQKGMNTFSFRPHAGEAGNLTHLVSAYLLADEIAHGIELKRVPVLQYLFYLSQIGLAMSPLSNNSLFLNYEKNPFPSFFARGMNVSLSTDDPLMFHFTRESLMEEYSIAAQVYHLSNIDLCEIARNSVIQSGWEHEFKSHWLGTARLYGKNDIRQSNVPNYRIKYRFETLVDEHLFIQKCIFIDNLKKKMAGEKDFTSNLPLSTLQLLSLLYRDKPQLENIIAIGALDKHKPTHYDEEEETNHVHTKLHNYQEEYMVPKTSLVQVAAITVPFVLMLGSLIIASWKR